MNNFTNTFLITTLVGIGASVLTGMIKAASDKVDSWHPLVKQGLVLVICIFGLLGLHFINIETLPAIYQTGLTTVIQAFVAAMSGIALHNVKDAVIKGKAGVTTYPE